MNKLETACDYLKVLTEEEKESTEAIVTFMYASYKQLLAYCLELEQRVQEVENKYIKKGGTKDG